MGGTQTVAAAPSAVDSESAAAACGAIEEAVSLRRPVLVSGPVRAGKTALLRAAMRDRRCYVGGGLASLAAVPYLALTRALRRPPHSAKPEDVACEIEVAVADGVLLIDDLQWCDPSTIEVMAALAGRIAVVGAVRPGEGAAATALSALRAAGALVLMVEPMSTPGDADLSDTRVVQSSATPVERIGRLSLRELEVLDLVACGLATSEIGVRLGVARTTVETYVTKATAKMGAANRREAAVLLRRLQL